MNLEDVIFAASTFFTLHIFAAFLTSELISQLILGWFISTLVPALIVGFIFGSKMVSAKLTSIAKVLVLLTVLFGLFLPSIVGFMDWNNFITGNPNSTVHAQDFWVFMRNSLFEFITINFLPLFLAIIPGLYVGLSLRKVSSKISLS